MGMPMMAGAPTAMAPAYATQAPFAPTDYCAALGIGWTNISLPIPKIFAVPSQRPLSQPVAQMPVMAPMMMPQAMPAMAPMMAAPAPQVMQAAPQLVQAAPQVQYVAAAPMAQQAPNACAANTQQAQTLLEILQQQQNSISNAQGGNPVPPAPAADDSDLERRARELEEQINGIRKSLGE